MEFKLEYLINDEVNTFFLNKEVITAGKLPSNDLQLDDKTVSRKHCKFVKKDYSFEVVDLNSTNGLYVNGHRIREKLLEVGDNIAIGRTILKFLAIAKKENYYDVDDQKISMVIPLSEEYKVETKKKIETKELNFLTSLTELGKNLIASSTLEDSLEKVGNLIFDYINLKRLFIFSYDDKQEELHLIHSQSKKGKEVKKVNISKTIAMKAIKEKVAILSSNTQDDSRFNGAESIILYGITSAISIPIWTKSSIYGLIYADTTHIEEMFAEKDLEILSIIANFTGLSIEGINNLNKLGREKKIRSRLERYLSPSVVSKIMESQDDISSEFLDYREAEATVLFLDIVGFTFRAENMKPVETGIFLNNFFTEMTDIIFKYNGTLDKYIGDGIMAVFGVPFPIKNHCELAIITALDMQKKIGEINTNVPNNKKIKVRMGINTGKLISGDFGSPKRFDYTVLGNTVNIASRLESTVAKADEIVVSETVYKCSKNIFEFEELGEKKIHGISKSIKTYKVIKEGGKMKKIIIILLLFLILGGCKKKIDTTPGQIKPGTPEYIMNEGLFHLNQGNATMAEKKLQQALKKKPDLIRALNALGLVYIYKRKFKKAISYFKKVLALNPKYIDAHNSLGLIYSELNQYELAKEHLLIAANSKNYRTPENSFVKLSMLELKNNKIDSASRYIEKAMEKNRRFAPVYNIKGIILENQKKYPEAIASYKKALSLLTEEDLTTLINIGRTYQKMGEKNKALDMLEKALSKANDKNFREKIKRMISEVEKL